MLITPSVVVVEVLDSVTVVLSNTNVPPLAGTVGSVIVPITSIGSLPVVIPLLPSGSSIAQLRPSCRTLSLYL